MLMVPLQVKTYPTERGVKAAVDRAGLGLVPFTVKRMNDGKFAPTFIVDLREDQEEIFNRGFRVRYEPAATNK